ncbi:LUD domain-containing protein [Reichenbachiella sp. MALMAid0571]|uniref:LutC/YkgG family protein n=1 Tax=Reichenbachiella sp. MALMAid0571 TaxID=3143939 RepID=UPI0032DF301B
MDSRAKILDRIRQNKPEVDSSFDLNQFLDVPFDDLVESYQASLAANGGNSLDLPDKGKLEGILLEEVGDKSFVDLTGIIKSKTSFNYEGIDQPKELSEVKILIVAGKLGVAENAAIWLDDDILHEVRALPFIVERTIFILDKNNLVPTMHHAYQTLGGMKSGFGTFIAGPSKTADIEQNLVIGAHGTKSHLVVLV